MKIHLCIVPSLGIQERKLYYVPWERSLDMEPMEQCIDGHLILNYLSIAILGGRMVQLSGYFSDLGWTSTRLIPPKAITGGIRVEMDRPFNVDYRLVEGRWPTYHDPGNGWTCTGPPDAQGSAVEFIRDCIAVIGDRGELLALWLKPIMLPDRTERA